LRYEPDVVTLTGTLREMTFPGLPNFEDVSKGDQPETGYYLEPAKPICTVAGAEDQPARQDVRLVQLVLSDAGSSELKARLGQQITLTGTLFTSFTGHHHAPLLLTVM
jgi:hypothetical protein